MVSLQAALVATLFSVTGQTVLLDFCADWCPPCRSMNPTIEALIKEGYPVRKVNIDQQPQLKNQYGVTSIPCFVMLVDGQEVGRVVGGTSFSCLERLCKRGLAARLQDTPPGEVAKAGRSAAGAIPIPVSESSGSPPRVQQASFTKPSAVGKSGPAADGSSGWTAVRGDPVAVRNGFIASSVRLRVDGGTCGSGTIVDARDGEALILTCGHIFRQSRDKSRIEVDLFGPHASQKIPGQLISYDLNKDIGLVAIRAPGPVKVAPVAPAGYKVKEGDAVVSVGCNNGDRPSVRHSRVTSVNRYEGPPNIEVGGVPVEGRSGGGLFTKDGKVIGVGFAADPRDKEGLYAALGSIHAQLDRAKLTFVYQTPEDPTQRATPATPAGTPPAPSVAKNQLAAPPRTSATVPSASRGWGPAPATGASSPQTLGPSEQAALSEIRRRLEEGAEVICVVRPRNQPEAKSEIIMFDSISPQMLQQLAAQGQLQNKLQPTSLAIPSKRSPRRPLVPIPPPSQRVTNNPGGWQPQR